jgi:hypothetical protein
MKPQTRTARYQRAIDELINTGSRKEAAHRAGVSVGTIDRWHKDRQFQMMLVKAQREATRSITTQVWNALSDARQTLQRNLNCGMSSSEIRAAVALFDIALRLAEATEVEERLQRLEAAVPETDRT